MVDLVQPEGVCGRCQSVGMTITGELPDDTATRPEASRQALEALAIEGYRSGALSHSQNPFGKDNPV